MSPAPFVERHVPAEHDAECICPPCRTHREQHPPSWAPIRRVFLRSLPILVALTILGLLIVHSAQAKEGGHSLPVVVQKAREACPNTASLVECRAALRRAYTAVAWQREAREHAQAATVRSITLDAINWAATRYGVSAAGMRIVASCESRLDPFATNGQYAGAWQLSTRHRSDPIFAVVPWQDAYAEASHVARYVKKHGWGEWQCTPSGGLRW